MDAARGRNILPYQAWYVIYSCIFDADSKQTSSMQGLSSLNPVIAEAIS